jgi:hypothetical protein
MRPVMAAHSDATSNQSRQALISRPYEWMSIEGSVFLCEFFRSWHDQDAGQRFDATGIGVNRTLSDLAQLIYEYAP